MPGLYWGGGGGGEELEERPPPPPSHKGPLVKVDLCGWSRVGSYDPLDPPLPKKRNPYGTGLLNAITNLSSTVIVIIITPGVFLAPT